MAELKRTYNEAGLDVTFRRSTRLESLWLDTEKGKSPKTKKQASLPQENEKWLGHFVPYESISDLDLKNPPIKLRSGEHQPRSL